MSSEVTTQENWARLHVARRVRDIAKSMIRLSKLGRSIFPMTCRPRLEVEEPAVGLKVSEKLPQNEHTSEKPYLRNEECGGSDDFSSASDRCSPHIRRTNRGLPALPSSPHQACSGFGTHPSGGRHGWCPSPIAIRRADLVMGTDPKGSRNRRRQRVVAGPAAPECGVDSMPVSPHP